jgi:HAD superfamily hydrolase (TIGR01549 family)
VSLLARSSWIFDLDGTLTVAAHDFDAIRDALGLRPGEPILEQLAEMGSEDAAPLREQLWEIECGIADRGVAQPGAARLLAALEDRGIQLGIVTRNRSDLAWRTLAAAGLDAHFAPGFVLGRDDAPPKPSPAALQILLDRWSIPGSDAVMVGDYLFDLQAGWAAGTAAVHFDVTGAFPWPDACDRQVSRLDALLEAD